MQCCDTHGSQAMLRAEPHGDRCGDISVTFGYMMQPKLVTISTLSTFQHIIVIVHYGVSRDGKSHFQCSFDILMLQGRIKWHG
jgi:hypothetical protein